MASLQEVPLVDLSGTEHDGRARSGAVSAIRQACENVGFLIVEGHGVEKGIIENLESSARSFFALPHEVKMRSAGPSDIYRGFQPSEGSALAASRDHLTPPDLCESFTVNRFDDVEIALRAGLRPGREAFFAPNIWPEYPENLRGAFDRYYSSMENLAGHIMRLMALALDLDESWFEDKIIDHISNLTVNHYPALGCEPRSGQLRRGAHSDWGSLTLLYHDGRPGLQIDRSGQWTDVPVVPGSFVVNLGDLMARWTNNRWVSTLHRVVVPEHDRSGRLSIAFFHQPAYDADIETIPTCVGDDDASNFEATTSGEWILSMLRKTMY